MLNVAREWELIHVNPAVRVKRHPEKGRERFLSSEEFSVLWEAIDAEERRSGAHGCPSLFRLLILTGARLREVMHAKWEWVRWDERCIALPDSKTGQKRLPLSRAAIEELERLSAFRTSAWIIAGVKPDRPLSKPYHAWSRVRVQAHSILNKRREEAKLPPVEKNPFADVRLHDLRHSFASVMVARGRGLPIIGKALGHSDSSTTERYSHLAADPVLEAVDEAGAIILEAVRRPHAVVEKVAEPLQFLSVAHV